MLLLVDDAVIQVAVTPLDGVPHDPDVLQLVALTAVARYRHEGLDARSARRRVPGSARAGPSLGRRRRRRRVARGARVLPVRRPAVGRRGGRLAGGGADAVRGGVVGRDRPAPGPAEPVLASARRRRPRAADGGDRLGVHPDRAGRWSTGRTRAWASRRRTTPPSWSRRGPRSVDDADGKATMLRTQLGAVQPGVDVADPLEHGRTLTGIRGMRLHVDHVRAKLKYGGNVDDAHRAVVGGPPGGPRRSGRRGRARPPAPPPPVRLSALRTHTRPGVRTRGRRRPGTCPGAGRARPGGAAGRPGSTRRTPPRRRAAARPTRASRASGRGSSAGER